MKRLKGGIAIVLLQLVGFLLCFGLVGCGAAPSSETASLAFHATDVSSAPFSADFSLLGHDGRRYTLKSFRGKLVIVFLGFTFCEEVCPATLFEISQAMNALGSQRRLVQPLFISIDPVRDTPARLKSYLSGFSEDFLGLSGSSPDRVRDLAAALRLTYKKVQRASSNDYIFEHMGAGYVFDQKGRLRLFFRQGIGAKPLAEDLRALLKEQ